MKVYLNEQEGVKDLYLPLPLRARSQIPVASLTGGAPGWSGALKLLGAAV